MVHRLIAALSCANLDALLAALARLPPAVNVAEIRLDALWPGPPEPDAATDAILALVDASPVPLVATLRPIRQGGAFSGDEQVRVGLLAAAGQAGFSFVDLEADVATPSLVREFGKAGVEVIVSTHLVGPTPCRDDGLKALTAAQDATGVLDKFAFAGHSFVDTLRALELASQHAARGGRPVVSTTGHGGPAVRALLALAGNQATYGHAPGLESATPGQPAVADIAAVWHEWGVDQTILDAGAVPRPYLALLGNPVAQSLSPRMYNAALRAAGRSEPFGALEVPASPGALLLTLHAAPRIGLAGASITMPHKRDAARAVPGDAVVQAVGAANCIRFGAKGAESTNTDATALRRLLEQYVDSGAPAVVLGAGGLAGAAIWALRDLGAEVRFSSRDAARAQDLAKRSGARWTPWDERGELRAPVWVQATPIGRNGDDACPVQAAQLRGAVVALEGNYISGTTAFAAAARQAGAAVIDGRALLVEQGLDAFHFWFGTHANRAVMEGAVQPRPLEVPA